MRADWPLFEQQVIDLCFRHRSRESVECDHGFRMRLRCFRANHALLGEGGKDTRLTRANHDFTLCFLSLGGQLESATDEDLADMDVILFEVDILPAQPCGLTRSQPGPETETDDHLHDAGTVLLAPRDSLKGSQD
jgi:hypothetical protein